MRSLTETRTRWEETLKHSSTLAELQRAVKFNGPTSPCVAGCRSICWKQFLLFQHASSSDWSQVLKRSRNKYETLREQHLKFIKHPEQLNELTVDPLADTPDSPWDALRKDEALRAEILQDVQRLPDEALYHEESIQTMVLDILFIYCKLNPGAGGYRQGMHELLAPLVFVIQQDVIDRTTITTTEGFDPSMVDLLDSDFLEHDAFALFAKIMERAQSFYEIGRIDGVTSADQSAIVEKSKHIHEVLLAKVDPELADHLTNIEVLPQIFLIRWIRLLFSREFPFEQLLVLWDTIFAFDPSLQLIDLICVAMLIRIRWTLLDADYTVALQLLLRYPAPQPPHGPHTFVDDAVYLRDHLSVYGGSTLIFKYTGKAPAPVQVGSRPSTPSFPGFALHQRTLGARSPLSSGVKFLQQPGSVEALFQGAAKNVIERGEKLGINQAVRDAMGEIRRNVQGLQDSRNTTPGHSSADPFTSDDRPVSVALTIMERRNRQLAAMLHESVANLKKLASSQLEGEKAQDIEAIEVAAAKIQFVMVHLEDSSLALPEEDMPAISTLKISSQKENRAPTVALDTTPVVMTSAVEAMRPGHLAVNYSPRTTEPVSPTPMRSSNSDQLNSMPLPRESSKPEKESSQAEAADRMDTDDAPEDVNSAASAAAATLSVPSAQKTAPLAPASRPHGPIPTRSTLAQSSFAWMLEPDTKASSARSSPFPPNQSGGGGSSHRKKLSNTTNTRSRERNAFLFGEVTSDSGGESEHGGGGGDRKMIGSHEIFGLEPLPKRKGSGAKDAAMSD